ncbi:hypothetical protein CEXT_335451 [Caerostris extrusa]|uniref:Uncharacterized protein n=1 Tax=Caerostris extrusa TaxID=172846 RepID=A0AAV4XN12_CAEEX|nr:hypothetical protein CEXT_335451 [Caerostris extrusa]
MDRRKVGRTDRQKEGRTEGRRERGTDGRKEGGKKGRNKGRKEGRSREFFTGTYTLFVRLSIYILPSYAEGIRYAMFLLVSHRDLVRITIGSGNELESVSLITPNRNENKKGMRGNAKEKFANR